MWNHLLKSSTRNVNTAPAVSDSGVLKRSDLVMQTLIADDDIQLGRKSAPKAMPMWLGNILADVLTRLGPKGLDFAAYSIDYHTLRYASAPTGVIE